MAEYDNDLAGTDLPNTSVEVSGFSTREHAVEHTSGLHGWRLRSLREGAALVVVATVVGLIAERRDVWIVVATTIALWFVGGVFTLTEYWYHRLTAKGEILTVRLRHANARTEALEEEKTLTQPTDRKKERLLTLSARLRAGRAFWENFPKPTAESDELNQWKAGSAEWRRDTRNLLNADSPIAADKFAVSRLLPPLSRYTDLHDDAQKEYHLLDQALDNLDHIASNLDAYW